MAQPVINAAAVAGLQALPQANVGTSGTGYITDPSIQNGTAVVGPSYPTTGQIYPTGSIPIY